MNSNETSEKLQLANEFTSVIMTKRRTRNGERLEIFCPRSGSKVLLDPIQLESLTYQDSELYSDLINMQYSLYEQGDFQFLIEE